MSISLKEPYQLDPDFEKVVLLYAASKAKFWAVAGHVLDPDCMAHPLAKILLETIRIIAKESGHGPESTIIVIQRLQRRMYEGKVTKDQIKEVFNLFEDAEDLMPPPMEAITDELLPVLKRRLQSQAILLSHDEFAKKGDFAVVRQVLDKAASLGKTEEIASVTLDASGVSEINQNFVRLPTGIFDLDSQINFGLPIKQLGVWIGGTGDGKSMCLTHQAAEGVRQKLLVGFATLELPKAMQLARLYSNLVGVSVNDIIELDKSRKEVVRRVNMLNGSVGACEVAEFPPYATTVRDLSHWIDQCEQKHGVPMKLLCVDYADKLYEPKAAGRDSNEYTIMRYVYEGLRRDIAVARDMWVWTASAAKGQSAKEKKGVRDTNSAADSIHKVRIADMVNTLNFDEDTNMLTIFNAKNRTGKSRFKVGPFVTDYEKGRVVPLAKELMVW